MVKTVKTIHMFTSNRFIRRVIITLICVIILLSSIVTILQHFETSPLTLVNQQKSNLDGHPSSNQISHSKNFTQHKNTPPHQLQSVSEKRTRNSVESLIYRPANDSTILRALLLFYPNDQDLEFQSELRWFYRSWVEMMTVESPLWRTDLIIYTFEYAPLFKQLGCIFNEKRQNPSEPPKCRVFPYMRVKDRYAQHQLSSIHQTIDKTRSIQIHHYLKSYGYIDSINTVFEYRSSYDIYDFVLRTDMDCFLTKNFAHYVPFNHSLIVGYGGYSTTFTNRRLKRIAHDMNWKYANRNSLGSTWFVVFFEFIVKFTLRNASFRYGPPSMTHRMANFTITAMIHLTMHEFSTPEREQRLGVLVSVLFSEVFFFVFELDSHH